MCSRYELSTTNSEAVSLRFELNSAPDLAPIPEVRPTNLVPVIKSSGMMELLRWGLDHAWDNKPLINARSETLMEKKTFIPLLENRCLVPATAYFEWRKEGKKKFKTQISSSNENLIAFAGLYNNDRFTIITCEPSQSIAYIHNRMPAIMEKHSEKHWLLEKHSFENVQSLLTPYPDNMLSIKEFTPPTAPQGDLFR